MDRKDFIKKGAVGAFFMGISSAFGNALNFASKISKYRGVEGVLPPTNTHMVGDGFKVMNLKRGLRVLNVLERNLKLTSASDSFVLSVPMMS